VTRGQQATALLLARRESLGRATPARWLAAIACILYGSVVAGKPPAAGFTGVVSFGDGGPFTIVRRDSLLRGATGVALVAGDLVETGPNAFLVIQEPDGTLIGLGPSTGIFFVDREEIPTLFVLKGWVKADSKATPLRVLGAHFGVQGRQAVMLLYADEQSNAAYDEQGSITVLRPDAAPMPVTSESGPNHFFSMREDRYGILSQPSPSAEFVRNMPVAFRDPLPVFPPLPEPVPPQRLRAVAYADIQDWLTMPRLWRTGFVDRFRGRLRDPAFFAAMDAHLALFPEWTPILHPPPAPDSDRARDEPRNRTEAVPQKSEPQQGDEPR
jgi:hypothetical protein